MFKDGAVYCDKPLCKESFTAPGLSKGDVLRLAQRAMWHIPPCKCLWRRMPSDKWRHKNDYCPEHFPYKPRKIDNLPALLHDVTSACE